MSKKQQVIQSGYIAPDAESSGVESNARPRLMRRPEVEELTGYKCSAIYQKMREGTFPQSVRLSANRVAWIASEVHEWLDARIAESRNEQAEA